jgi:hypothetical protein
MVSPTSPEQVARAWSRALNAGDNEAAARLFANGAIVAQGGLQFVLATREDAVLWNKGLPCSGHIVEVTVEADVATAVFSLGHRPLSRCDVPPGTLAAARFTVRAGKIVGWEQIAVPGEDSSEA